MANKNFFKTSAGWNLVVFSRNFKADKNCLFELTDAFAGNAEKFTDLFESFFAVVEAKATSDDFTFTFLVDNC
ncbi:hypothetical protein D3C85_1520700 [compost metagenome]